MLTSDLALVCGDFPFSGAGLRNRCHSGVPVNLCPIITCALGQSLGEVSRLDIAIPGVTDRANQAICDRQWPDIHHLIWGQLVHLNTNGFRHTGILHIFIHPILRGGQTDIGHAGQAGILACFFFKAAIKIN